MPRATDLEPPHYSPSPALSLLHRPGTGGIQTRRVALLAAHGVDAATDRELYQSLLAAGAVPRIVSSHRGRLKPGAGAPIDIEISMEAGPAVMYDAAIILDGEQSAASLSRDAMALEFIRLQHRHCKPILAIGAGSELLKAAGIPPALPDGSDDPAVIVAESGAAVKRFT